jgi:hypothetical protein
VDHLGNISTTDAPPTVGTSYAQGTIYAPFLSKKVFKQAIGALYKQKLIEIDKDAIRLL